MASQITSLAIVYSTVYSRRKSKKTSKIRVTGLCAGISPVTGEIPAQRASNAENVSIWWRHHWLCRHERVIEISIMHWPNSQWRDTYSRTFYEYILFHWVTQLVNWVVGWLRDGWMALLSNCWVSWDIHVDTCAFYCIYNYTCTHTHTRYVLIVKVIPRHKRHIIFVVNVYPSRAPLLVNLMSKRFDDGIR